MTKANDSLDKLNNYTEAIRRYVPEYDEMLKSLFLFLPYDFNPKTILELGCGTGNLTELICQNFPDSNITAVDISAECIKECKGRIESPNIKYVQADFMDMKFPSERFDLIISSLSIHHIPNNLKGEFLVRLYNLQTQKGIFSFCDKFNCETEAILSKHISEWKEYAFKNGMNETEWAEWMKHQDECDHLATISEYYAWLKNAGYKIVDFTKRRLLWTTIYAEK